MTSSDKPAHSDRIKLTCEKYDWRTRNIVALLSRESASKSGPSRTPRPSAHHGVSAIKSRRPARVSPPLARDMRRRNPWQEVAGSSVPPGGAWITGEVAASCRGRVEGDSCQVAQLYGVCRWCIPRGPHVWNLVYASYMSACRDRDTTRTQWRAR